MGVLVANRREVLTEYRNNVTKYQLGRRETAIAAYQNFLCQPKYSAPSIGSILFSIDTSIHPYFNRLNIHTARFAQSLNQFTYIHSLHSIVDPLKMAQESRRQRRQRRQEAKEFVAQITPMVVPQPSAPEQEDPLDHVYPSEEFGRETLYILDWNHDAINNFCENMSKAHYKERVKVVLIKGSARIVSLTKRFKSAILASKVVKIRLTWEDYIASRSNRGLDKRLPEEFSKRVMMRILEGVDDTDCPVRQLVLEGVYWNLFTESNLTTILPALQGLELLTLSFEPTENYGRVQFKKQLGYILRLCRNLRALHLQFPPSPFQPGQFHPDQLRPQGEGWDPPNFGHLVEGVVFSKLEELTLEYTALDPEFAASFFEIHGKRLKRVHLNFLWNLPKLTPEEPKLTKTLVKARLEDIRLRGKWIRPTGPIGIDRYLMDVVWDDTKVEDLQEMRSAERRILQRGRNPQARDSSLGPDSSLHTDNIWQKFKFRLREFFTEKLRVMKRNTRD